MKPHNARNTIVRRAISVTGKWYLRMADGSIIKPETAIKRGLVTQENIDRALREEAAAKAAMKVKPPQAAIDALTKKGMPVYE